MVIDKVRKTIKDNNLISAGEHIVIGLSGGPDSVCLFHVLMRIKDELRLTIHPVHINHKFRPGGAERDQQYVEELCRKNGLECHTFVVDCNKLAAELGMTSEEAGRKARYDAFYQVASEAALTDVNEAGLGSNRVKIAVAQNANDQAETILFRLLRGTGTDGLAGIAYERQERGIKVIRPLLDVPRTEIETYCNGNHLNPVIDHTNSEAIYARNKIRLELIPYLENGYNENIKQSLVRLGRIAAADKDYLWQQAESAYNTLILQNSPKGASSNLKSGQSDKTSSAEDMEVSNECLGKASGEVCRKQIVLDRVGLAGLHKSIRHRVVFKAFSEIGLTQDITEERLESADFIIGKKQGAKVVQFPHDYRLEVASGKVRFFREKQ